MATSDVPQERFRGISENPAEPQASDEFSASPSKNFTAVCDLAALRHNLKLIQRSVAVHQEVIACVKANAYGHGLRVVSECLVNQGVRWLAVGSAADALSLRQWGVKCRILLFPTVGEWDAKLLAAEGITVGIQSFEDANTLACAVRGQVSVFLKVDAGLGRLGVSVDGAPALVSRIVSELPSVGLDGIFTHLPFAETDEITWVEMRTREFMSCLSAIRRQVKSPLIVQCLASSGISFGLKAPETNAVCPGELLFGLNARVTETTAGVQALDTQPVLTDIRSIVGALRYIPSGTRFGFGGRLIASHKTRLGVLPIGYSNSVLVPRGEQAVGLLGHVAPLVMVALEHAVVDVTAIPEVYEGCPVYLLSHDPALGLTLNHLAERQKRSVLEVLTSLTGRASYEYEGS